MIAVIIAGGKGTRLDLTDIPKPMIDIDGVPLLKRQIEAIKKYGIRYFYILSGHLSETIKDFFGDGSHLGVSITHITEKEPLGTAGSIKQLDGIIKDRFLLFYGDILFDIDIDSLLAFDKKDSIATIVAHPNNHPYDSDLIDIDKTGKVIDFFPKPHEEDIYYKNLVNSGIYIFSPEIFKYIPPGKQTDIGKNILPFVKQTMYAYVTPEYIKDIGTPDRLTMARLDFISGKVQRLNKKNKRKAIFLDRDGVINKFIPDLCNPDDFILLPYIEVAIKAINASEYLAIIVTNQSAISKGFLTENGLTIIHKKMETLLGRKRAYIDGIYFCPHHYEKGFDGEVPELKIDCKCRKPKPGMLLQAQRDFNIDMENSWMIGDSKSDIQAGIAAGCKTIVIGLQHAGKEYCKKAAANLLCAVKHIGLLI